MIPGQKIYLGFIVDQQGRSLYVDYSGARPMLKFQQTPYPLRYMPDAWQDTKINYSRNMKWFGLNRTYSNQYKFVKDGAFIIRSIAYGSNNNGIEGKIYYLTLRWNPDNGIHEFYSKAEIDLSELDDDPLTGVTVNLIEGGPSKLLKAREAVVYEIACNARNPDAKLITNDGVELNAKYNFSFVNSNLTGLQGDNDAATFAMPIAFLNFEGNSVGIVQGEPSFEYVTDRNLEEVTEAEYIDALAFYADEIGPANYLMTGANAFTQVISSTVVLTNNTEIGTLVRLLAYTSGGQLIWLTPETPVNPGEPKTFTISETITLAADDKLYIMAYCRVVADYDFSFSESPLSSELATRNAVSLNYGLTAYDYWKQLILKLTDGKYTGESSYLAGLTNIMMTCGDALRGIETAVIKGSLNDFADKSFIKILNGGVGIDYNTNQILFERKEYFFDNSQQAIDLGEVSDFGIDNAKEFNWSSVKAGWPVKDTTDNLGKQEYNDTKNWLLPLTRTSSVLDLVSFYRADIFAMEQIRSDYFEKDNTATSKDNDVFIINTVEDGDDIVPLRINYDSITGVDNPTTLYNIEQLTPKRILETNASYIGIPFYALQAEYIKYQSGTRNDALATTYPSGGRVVIEKEDILINDLKALAGPFAHPFYFKFKTKVPVNFIQLLQANNGYINFTVNGIPLQGFAMDLSQLPVYDEPQEWKLLCSSLVDLETLISLNDIYNINGPGMISHKLPMKFVPLNAVYSEQYHFRHMDTDWHKNRISRYSQKKPFGQKMQTNDNTPLQFITNGTQMNNVIIVNGKGTTKGTVVPTEVSHPAINLPMQLWHATIDWSNFDPNETYYAKISFGVGDDVKHFISEPVHLKTEWPNTLFLIASNATNKRDMIFNTTIPFEIKVRIEGMIQKFEPQATFTSYEDQTADIELLNGEPYRKWQLQIGAGIGTPDWLIDKINRVLLLTDITIDGFAYTIDKDSKLEMVEVPGSPYAFWTITIREKNNRAGIDIEQGGINETELTVEYDIDTAGFSSDQNPNVNNQNNIIQIIDVE